MLWIRNLRDRDLRLTSAIADPNAAGRSASGIGAAVVPLLALSFFINFVDRGTLATAAPFMKDQLQLSSTQIGVLFSAFSWSYVPAQILAGWMAERLNPYRTLAMGLALWSAATAASGLATGFLTLLVLRIILGLGESAAFPSGAKLLAQHLPSHKLGSANGLIAAGMGLGPAFATFVGGLLMAGIGWRMVFILFGLASLAWLAPWHACTRRASALAGKQPGGSGPPLRSLIRRKELWGACLGHFCANYAFYFVVSWLPLYLVKERGLSVAHMAKIGGLIFLVFAASSFLAGQLSDRWVRGGASTSRVRKTCVISAHLGTAASLGAAAIGSVNVSVASLFCAAVAFGLGTQSVYAIGQTLAGPQLAGRWIGIQSSVGNLAGIVGPLITGAVVDRSGQYYWAFIITAAVAITGIVGWGALITKVETLKWKTVPVARCL